MYGKYNPISAFPRCTRLPKCIRWLAVMDGVRRDCSTPRLVQTISTHYERRLRDGSGSVSLARPGVGVLLRAADTSARADQSIASSASSREAPAMSFITTTG